MVQQWWDFYNFQDLVEHAVISVHTGRNMSAMPGVTLQQMPYPCYIEDRFIIAIARTFPMFMTLAWVYSASMIIKSIVHEKEMRCNTRIICTIAALGLGRWIFIVMIIISQVEGDHEGDGPGQRCPLVLLVHWQLHCHVRLLRPPHHHPCGESENVIIVHTNETSIKCHKNYALWYWMLGHLFSGSAITDKIFSKVLHNSRSHKTPSGHKVLNF